MSEGMSHWQGWLYVAAVLIPLAAFIVEILAIRWLKHWNAYVATAAIGTSCLLSLVGFVSYVYNAPAILAAHHPEEQKPVVAPDHVGPHLEPHEPLAWKGQFNWIVVGRFAGSTAPPPLAIPFGIYIDNLAVIMFVMVTFIATLIHVYSIGYMRGDVRYARFFAYLSLFCFSMLGLVASSNIFMIFIFWELVGVCSYLLIGHWYEEKKNADAANKAFIVNRVGDVGMLLGIGLIWTSLGTFNIHDINVSLAEDRLRDAQHRIVVQQSGETVEVKLPEVVAENQPPVERTHRMPYWILMLAGLGVFAGCMGKSAQFPLHVWLPDAMAGPTPVSALIHAATMVAAGVYLVGRFFPLFTHEVLLVIAYVGGITLFIAASIAIVQTDYKKVLAYSTVSQLGFMILALGVGGWSAGLFHLLTHAFFKALLFLGAGSVYHAVHTYDIPVLGGLRRKMPITAYTMLAGTLAISGVPLFSGFYSKDAIMATSLYFVTQHPEHILLFLLPAVGAAMTAFYMFRMWFLLFTGEPRGYAEAAAHGHAAAHGAHDHEHDRNPAAHAHESEPIMTWPLILLAIPTVFIGWPLTIVLPMFGFEPVLEGMLAYGQPLTALNIESVKWWAVGASVLILTAGLGLAGTFYAPYAAWKRFDAAHLAQRFPGPYRFLVHKWWFDELYHATLVRFVMAVSQFFRQVDQIFIDGIVNGSARIAVLLSKIEGVFDLGIVDGIVNLVGRITYVVGDWGRVVQTGRLRNYLMFLAVGLVVLFVGVFAWIHGA